MAAFLISHLTYPRTHAGHVQSHSHLHALANSRSPFDHDSPQQSGGSLLSTDFCGRTTTLIFAHWRRCVCDVDGWANPGDDGFCEDVCQASGNHNSSLHAHLVKLLQSQGWRLRMVGYSNQRLRTGRMPGVSALAPAWNAGVECCLSEDTRPKSYLPRKCLGFL
jgi:hypothetical protein